MARRPDPLTAKQLAVMRLMKERPGISSGEMAKTAQDHHGPFHPDPVLNRLNKDCKTHPALARLGPPNEGHGRFGWYLTDYGARRLREVDGPFADLPRRDSVRRGSELDGESFRWRGFNFELEPNALLRPWWTAAIQDPQRPGHEMFRLHVGPRINGDGAVDELAFQAIVSLPSLEEGVEPFELAHAVGTSPKLALDTVMVMAETNAASLTTMLKVINDSVTTP